MRGDWYYQYVLERPIPPRLIRDLRRVPIVSEHKVNGFKNSPRRTFVPRARRGQVERAHDAHLRRLVKGE